MKYLFILGRNLDLSVAELVAYFEKEGNPLLDKILRGNSLLVEVEFPIDLNVVNFLGGVVSMGEVLEKGKIDSLISRLEDKMIYFREDNKLNYSVWDFSSSYEVICDYLKKRFKEEKLKATEKHLRDKIDLQNGEKAMVPSSKLLDEEYFLFEDDGLDYFGRIVSHCDYEKIEERDVMKPSRRSHLAISPRLGKILINLSQAREGDLILDPFCGVGTVLQEALLQGMKVVGVDKDAEAIKSARKNLEWFNFDKKDYDLINFDSTKVNIPGVSCVATEPDLGEVLKKIPTKEKAEDILKGFEKLMVGVINNIKGKVKGRIVFTSPYIRIGKKRLQCDIENICSRTGFELLLEPIAEFRHNQIVGRMIYVLKKT